MLDCRALSKAEADRLVDSGKAKSEDSMRFDRNDPTTDVTEA